MRLILVLLFLPMFASSQMLLNNGRKLVTITAAPVFTGYADSAQFVFSNTSTPKTGYTNVVGDPVGAIRSATGAYSIGVTSISTGRWTATGGGIAGASDNGGQSGAAYLGYWFQQTNTTRTIADSNLRITGLVPGAQYVIRFFASRSGTSDRRMAVIVRDANGDTTAATYNVGLNTATYLSLGRRTARPDGTIVCVISNEIPYNATHPYAYLGIAEIKRFPRL